MARPVLNGVRRLLLLTGILLALTGCIRSEMRPYQLGARISRQDAILRLQSLPDPASPSRPAPFEMAPLRYRSECVFAAAGVAALTLLFDVVPFERTWFGVESFSGLGSNSIWIHVHWPGPGGDLYNGCAVALDGADPRAEAYLQRIVTALASLGSATAPNRWSLGDAPMPTAYPHVVDARDAAQMTTFGAVKFLRDVANRGDVLRRGLYHWRTCPDCPPECSLDLEGIASGAVEGPGRYGRPYFGARFLVMTIDHEGAFQRSARIWVSGLGADGMVTRHCTLFVRLEHPDGEAYTNRLMTALVAVGAQQEPNLP